MATPVGPAEVEDAINQVKRTVDAIKSRNRMLSVKVKDIEDTLNALFSFIKDLGENPPTKELVESILSYNRKLSPVVLEIRNLVRQIESICDKIEDLIP